MVSDEWSDTWWELRPPGNVRISQVSYYVMKALCVSHQRYPMRSALLVLNAPRCSVFNDTVCGYTARVHDFMTGFTAFR